MSTTRKVRSTPTNLILRTDNQSFGRTVMVFHKFPGIICWNGDPGFKWDNFGDLGNLNEYNNIVLKLKEVV